MIIAPIIILRRNNFYYSWIGIEISLFGFIPLFLGFYVESIVKYFVIQARGRAIILISVVIESKLLYFISLSLKLGIFPFFQWVPMVITSLRWLGCAVMTTVQKIAPLIIIFHSRREYFFYSAILSILFGGFIGVNQTYIRELISYSSISHRGWITLSLMISIHFFFIYLTIYFTINLILMNIFGMNRTNQTRDVGRENLTTSLLILTILGIPPFSIFFLKCWILIYLRIPFQLIAVIGTAWAAFYYISVIINTLSLKMNKKTLVLLLIVTATNVLIIWVLKKLNF